MIITLVAVHIELVASQYIFTIKVNLIIVYIMGFVCESGYWDLFVMDRRSEILRNVFFRSIFPWHSVVTQDCTVRMFSDVSFSWRHTHTARADVCAQCCWPTAPTAHACERQPERIFLIQTPLMNLYIYLFELHTTFPTINKLINLMQCSAYINKLGKITNKLNVF